MNTQPTKGNETPSQFTLMRLLVATAMIAAVIATVRWITLGKQYSPALPILVGGSIAAAVAIATLSGAWLELVCVAVVFFPVSIAVAIAPGYLPIVLANSLATVVLLLLIRWRIKPRHGPAKDNHP